jgi:hypothetical protein
MSTKISEISKEGRDIVKTVFAGVIKSDLREDWKKAIDFATSKISQLENGERGQEMFNWRSAKKHLLSLYGKKFISR